MSDDGPRSAGPEHDAWLREALRHAPDAGTSPPPSLRDAILAEARAAARTPTSPRPAASLSLLDRALAFWSWLARPPVAAGFASVMAATLVGMLWWDRPMDETLLPPRSSPAVAVPSPAPEQRATGEVASPTADENREAAPSADRLRESARSSATAPGPRDASPAPAKTAPPRAAADAAATDAARKQQATRAMSEERTRSQAEAKLADRSAAAHAERERKDDELAKASPPSTTAAPAPLAAPPTAGSARPAAEAPSPFPARSPRENDATRPPAPEAAAPPAAPAPPPASPAPAMPQPGLTPSRPEPFALAKKAESGEKDDAAAKARAAPPTSVQSATPPAGALGGAALDRSETRSAGRTVAQGAAEAGPRQGTVPAARPMAPLLASLASEETRWSRRLTNGDSVAVDAALRGWLAQVQAATPRWQAVADRSARRDTPTASSSTSPAILRLERDGAVGAEVQIEDGGVLFEPLSGSAWFAPLPPEVVARLRATLPPAPR